MHNHDCAGALARQGLITRPRRIFSSSSTFAFTTLIPGLISCRSIKSTRGFPAAHRIDGLTVERRRRRAGNCGIELARAHSRSSAGPVPPRDPHFVALGKAYLPELGAAYAAAWEEGAKQLEAGGGISTAVDAVAKSWSSGRTQLYDHVLTPEFAKIVAESIKDTDVSADERAAMAAAWRGLALGLAK